MRFWCSPNSKRWDYSDTPGGGHKKIKGPAHMVEGGHHLRKAPNPHPQHSIPSHRAHDAIITSLWRQNDVVTSFRRHNDVIITSCARWDPFRSMTIGPPIPDIQFDLENSSSKVPQSVQHPVDIFPLCFTSGHPIDSCPFCSMTIGPPIPEIQFDLENSRSKVKVKGQGQRYPSQLSIQLNHFRFDSHQLDQPFLRYGK